MSDNRALSLPAATDLLGCSSEDVQTHYCGIAHTDIGTIESVLGTVVEWVDADTHLSREQRVIKCSRPLLSHVSMGEDPKSGRYKKVTLVEVYHNPHTRAGIPIRIVRDALNDIEVRELAASEFAKELVRIRSEDDFQLVQTNGILRYLVEEGTHPVYRRMQHTLTALQEAARQIGRFELQVILTHLGLGRINGLSMDDLKTLTGDQFARILAGVKKGWNSSAVAGGLYYLLDKGTSSEEYTTWYDTVCTQHGWDATRIDDALFMVKSAGLEATSDMLVQATTDAPAFFLENIRQVGDQTDSRRATLSYLSQSEVSVVLEGLMAASPLNLDQIQENGNVPPLEIAAALLKAAQNGLPSDDPQAVTLVEGLDQYARIAMLRMNGFSQDWSFKLLQNMVKAN